MNAPPSTEQLLHEMRAWSTTSVGNMITSAGIPATMAESMTRHCPDLNDQVLGDVLLRLASHLAEIVNEVGDVPLWMLTNLIGAAGADLIDKGQSRG